MYDFDILQKKAVSLEENGLLKDALKIYLFMADGDTSLDGGYLGERIGHLYEKMGELHAAKYWYGRAVEENPEIEFYQQARRRLEHININDVVDPGEYLK
jgi:hypothetical protein